VVRGTVFNDRNGDGVRQDGEPGLAGWKLFLDANANGTRDEGERGATTNTSGRYGFEQVPAGDYRLIEIVPEGWTVTSPAGGFYAVTVVAGQTVADRDFGNRRNVQEPPPPPPPPQDLGSVSGVVFDDLDADGVRDEGEPGLRGARVYVDANNNGRKDERERRAITSETGAYTLVELAPGSHVVRHLPPEGYRATGATEGAVQVTAGGVAVGPTFSATRRSEVGGDVFNDANRNRRPDPGEALAGWTILLDLNRNGVADAGEPTAVTDAAGRYSFLVDRGTYRVVEVVPEGWHTKREGVANVRVGSGRVIERDFVNRQVDTTIRVTHKRKPVLFGDAPILP
jgi:hypothetical protein